MFVAGPTQLKVLSTAGWAAQVRFISSHLGEAGQKGEGKAGEESRRKAVLLGLCSKGSLVEDCEVSERLGFAQLW